jgi:hypothetical protein
VASCCECGDKPLGSGTTDLVSEKLMKHSCKYTIA